MRKVKFFTKEMITEWIPAKEDLPVFLNRLLAERGRAVTG